MRCQACNRLDQGMQFYGLGEMPLETSIDCFRMVFDTVKCGEGYRWSFPPEMLGQISHFANELIVIHFWHADVANYYIQPATVYLFQSLGGTNDRNHLGMAKSQHESSDLQRDRLVIYN
jgi:hypothetical protein